MTSMSIFIALSLCYGFVGAILIALYAEQREQNASLLHFLASTQYRIYFLILSLCSFGVLMWQGVGVSYAILMFLFVLGIIDIKCLAIPDVLNFSLLFICVIYAFLDSSMIGDSFVYRVLLGFGVGGIFFVLKAFYQSLSDRDIIGEADIIVLSSLGIAFGAINAFVSVFLGSIAALVYALILYLFFKRSLFSLKLPFCFFIFLGTMVYFIWIEIGI